MKQLKLTPDQACLLLLLGCACGLRALLAWGAWPPLNSDEGTLGIMALHIQHGERPIFFYGQNYMGALEAYIAALLFQFLGISLFTLRLGLILLFVLFLLCMYLLTSQIYNKRFALFVVLVLSLGSSPVFSRQLIALGGYAETLVFTALLFLLAFWLIRTLEAREPQQPMELFATRSTKEALPRRPRGWTAARRWAGYACWGLVLGLGLWSDVLILPWALCAGILLLLFCWRDLLRGTLFALLGGLLLGALPLVIYNLGAAAGQDSWSVLIGQQGGVPLTPQTLLQQLQGTLAISIPTITGSPFCHMDELANIKILGFAPSQPLTLRCSLLGGSWSLLYLGLLLLAAIPALRMARKALLLRRSRSWTREERSEFVRAALLISLFVAALLTLLLYMHSHSPIDEPAEYARYLICLWVVIPLALWPLWLGATRRVNTLRPRTLAQLRPWLYRALLLALLLVLCYGSGETLNELPQAQATAYKDAQLIAGLSRHSITHIYTDYWSCDRLAFASQERIICGVLSGGCTLQRGVHNRYEPYYTIVSHDPRSSYVILTSTHCDEAVAQRMRDSGTLYRTFTLNDYTVYQPV